MFDTLRHPGGVFWPQGPSKSSKTLVVFHLGSTLGVQVASLSPKVHQEALRHSVSTRKFVPVHHTPSQFVPVHPMSSEIFDTLLASCQRRTTDEWRVRTIYGYKVTTAIRALTHVLALCFICKHNHNTYIYISLCTTSSTHIHTSNRIF